MSFGCRWQPRTLRRSSQIFGLRQDWPWTLGEHHNLGNLISDNSGVEQHAGADLGQAFASSRTTTPPSGVSVRTDSGRTRLNLGAIRFCQGTEKPYFLESVSIWMKGGWKETRRLQRPISAKPLVSESRMATLNPFETKRKKALSGASSRVCDMQVAEGEGFEPPEDSRLQRFSRPPQSTTLPSLRGKSKVIAF